MDIVYLWCDDLDEIWHNKRLKYLNLQQSEYNTQAVCKGRFVQNDELKYSLRSVAQYMSWVNNIYIVTDNQIPDWLNLENPQIHIVDHSDIIEEKYLPLFNSDAIETQIYKIKGLSENFMLFNDDMFLNKNVYIKDLLDKNNYPIFRMIHNKLTKKITQYVYKILQMQKIINKKFNYQNIYFPHHNVDVYNKFIYAECVKEFSTLISRTLSHKFRDNSDWQRILVTYYSLCKKYGTLKVVDDYKYNLIKWLKHYLYEFGYRDSLVISLSAKKYIHKLKHQNPLFFCLEDGENVNDEDRLRGKQFLKKRFKNKSPYEK